MQLLLAHRVAPPPTPTAGAAAEVDALPADLLVRAGRGQ
eukprot:CAMPEP_0168402670 /NCGR_PEP_ID=MMETSP0228-20121227/23738_1 /TAXON_ID=133427 /ORGANISM="Protoceratium reticulatum, Strain CCCM 535 (=CCMP 1889)" /LENGTH=38 /DNA_ID= /DNA_START= /DNA_END= /DNA_ORIENTATION=